MTDGPEIQLKLTNKIFITPAADAAEVCGNCRFYLFTDGVCRRHAPQNIANVTEQRTINGKKQTVLVEYIARFPPMFATGWCGEFQRIRE